MSFKPLMSLCGKHSLQFSLNKIKSFLMEHHADPWVFFIRVDHLECGVIDSCKADVCVVLCCMNRSRAYCMSNTSKAFMSDPINEGEDLERVWFYCLNIYTLAMWEPVCNITICCHVLLFGAEEQTGSVRRGWPMGEPFLGGVNITQW